MFTVTNTFAASATKYELRPCRCDCWFCRDCCRTKGLKLRSKLVPILGTFRGITMVTLTVDPSLFPSPRAAFDHLTQRRCVARTLAELHPRGHTCTNRFFAVMEWQRYTE